MPTAREVRIVSIESSARLRSGRRLLLVGVAVVAAVFSGPPWPPPPNRSAGGHVSPAPSHSNAFVLGAREGVRRSPGFVFTAAGDFGANGDTSAVLGGIASSGSAFHLALGDFSYSQMVPESRWCEYVTSEVGASFPFELISGSHEDDGPDGRIEAFAACLPNRIRGLRGSYGTEYYFDYGGLARFIQISPGLTIDGQTWSYGRNTSHAAWLAQAIDGARSAGIPWVIVSMHKNCISMGAKTCQIGSALMNLLVQKRVDLILQGHDHNYQRSKQLALSESCPALPVGVFNETCVPGAQTRGASPKGAGSVLVIAGTGGIGLYGVNRSDAEAGYFAAWHGSRKGFTKFVITKESLTGSFVGTSSGTFADNFTIGSSGEPPPVTSFTPKADAHVSARRPGTNYGTRTMVMATGSSSPPHSYLRFHLRRLPAPILRATLRVHATRDDRYGFKVRPVADASWGERWVTYANAPPIGRGGVSSGSIRAGWLEVDVTTLVSADKVTIALTAATSTASVQVGSRESGATSPVLSVETAVDAAPPSVSIDEPGPGTAHAGGGTSTLRPGASDGADLAPMEPLGNEVLKGIRIGDPWVFSWPIDAHHNTAHTLGPRADDPAGNSASSSAVSSLYGISVPATSRNTYYLDALAGDDARTGRSEAEAWKTLARASSAPLLPGDRLLLRRGGRWTDTLRLSVIGTAAEPIRVGAWGSGALPVLTGASTCLDLAGSFIHVTDLHVNACTWAGIAVAGGNNRIESNVVSNNAVGVYLKSGSAGNAVLRNVIVDNNRMSVLTTSRLNDDSGAFGILIRGDRNDIGFNRISGSDAFSHDYGRDGAAIEIFGGRNNAIHHNLAVDNNSFTELGSARSSDNTYAYNVVRSSLAGSTFLVTRGANVRYGPVLRTRAYNNTVYLTGNSSQGFVCHAGCHARILTLRNNVIQATWKVGYADGPFDEDHNLYFAGRLQFTRGAASKVADPRFVDARAGDLHLSSGSPGIDAGVDVGQASDFDGAPVPTDADRDGVAAPDMGAFEHKV